MNDKVIVEIKDHVAHVQLNRPEKMNALDAAMFDAIFAAGEGLKASAEVRAVVLSGIGKAFCAGIDMATMAALFDNSSESSPNSGGGGKLEHRSHGLANRFQSISWVWRELEVPVIAALHGVAFGGGCQLSMGADIRYAAPGTRLSIMELKWGLVPDMGATPYIHKCLRDDVLRELTYTNRIVAADEAQELGLITRVCDDPLEAALATAGEIALKNPDAVRGAKRILNKAPFQQADEILLQESIEQARLVGTANQREAMHANLEKRHPVFKA